jgi:AhpD family alkylhydroperoxidase
MNHLTRLATTCCLLWSSAVYGADSMTAPRPIPLTRPEMKHLLEDLKDRKPRIPLPELNADEKARLGNRADDYEYRLRYHYLPRTDGRGSVSFGGSDPNISLDYAFKTMMFWIVSRTNNCQYCLGHQEIKLAVAGLEEDRVAALDSDWGQFTPAQQAAFAFARKLTFEPHRLSDSDIENLRQHYRKLFFPSPETTRSIAGKKASVYRNRGTVADSCDGAPPQTLRIAFYRSRRS